MIVTDCCGFCLPHVIPNPNQFLHKLFFNPLASTHCTVMTFVGDHDLQA
jgi:hypothetical protein